MRKKTLLLSEIIGTIVSKEPKKVYAKDNPFYGQVYYRLKVLTTDQEKLTFFAYPNLVTPTLWKTLTSSHYVDKRYLLSGEKRKKGFILHSAKELKPEEVKHD